MSNGKIKTSLSCYIKFLNDESDVPFDEYLTFRSATIRNNFNAMFCKSPFPGAMKYTGLVGRPYFRQPPRPRYPVPRLTLSGGLRNPYLPDFSLSTRAIPTHYRCL